MFAEEPLFLIPKSHPESQHPLVEWRISFSFVERRILLNIPEYQRTAYLYLKLKLECKMQENKLLMKSYKSYHLKTVLLELTFSKYYCTDGIHNAYEFTKSLIERFTEALQKRNLPNFFLPSQNLFENEDLENDLEMSLSDCYNEIEQFLKTEHYTLMTFSVTDLSLEINTSINKSEDIPYNIMLMFLTELYHEFMIPFFDKLPINYSSIFIIKRRCTIKDYWIPLTIKIKRIIRLIVLHQRHSATTSSTTTTDEQNNAFDEVLNYPIETAAKYLEIYQSILPERLPQKKDEVMDTSRKLFSYLDEQMKGKDLVNG